MALSIPPTLKGTADLADTTPGNNHDGTLDCGTVTNGALLIITAAGTVEDVATAAWTAPTKASGTATIGTVTEIDDAGTGQYTARVTVWRVNVTAGGTLVLNVGDTAGTTEPNRTYGAFWECWEYTGQDGTTPVTGEVTQWTGTDDGNLSNSTLGATPGAGDHVFAIVNFDTNEGAGKGLAPGTDFTELSEVGGASGDYVQSSINGRAGSVSTSTTVVWPTQDGTPDTFSGAGVAFIVKASAAGDGTATPGAIAVSTSIPQATPIVPLVVHAQTTANSATSTASLAFDSGGFAAGEMAVVVVSCDNAGSAGVSSLASVTDAGGNTYTPRQTNTYDPGAANAGQTVGIFTAPIVTPLSATDDITVNFSPNTTSKAVAVWRITPGAGYAISYVTGNTTAGSATGTPTVTTSSITAGQVVIAALAAESNATVTADSDTTNGAWSAQQTATGNTGTSGTSSRVASQYKHVTGTGTQTYNPTITSCDNLLAWISVEAIVSSGTASPSAIAVPVTLPAVTTQAGATASPAAIAVPVTLPQATAHSFSGLYPASVSGREILDQNSDPWPCKGVAVWTATQNLTNAEITTLLEGVAARGFNTVMMAPCGLLWNINGGASNRYENENGDPFFTGTPFQSSLGSAWASVDHFMDEASRLGLIVFFTWYAGWGSTYGIADEISAASDAQVRTTGSDVAARYPYTTHPNLVWVFGADREFTAASTVGQRLDSICRGVEDQDTVRLWTGHPAKRDDGGSTSAEDQFGTGYTYLDLDINSIYSWQDAFADEFDSVYAEAAMPVINIEPVYVHNTGVATGKPSGAEIGHASGGGSHIREQAWVPIIRGGNGVVFGDEDLWPFDATGLFDGGATWEEVLDDPDGTHDNPMIWLSHLWDFIDAHPSWSDLVPDADTFLTSGEGTGTSRASAGLAGDLGLVYFPNSRGSIVVDTTQITGTANVRLRWFDPTDGTYDVISASEAQNASRGVTYPSSNSNGNSADDWVLVVDLAADATATPAAIAVAATLPATTPQAGSTPTPAAIAAPVALPAPTTQAGSAAAPAAIPVPVTLPTPTPQAGSAPTPAAISVPVTLPAPSASGGTSATATPAAIPIPVTLPAPTPLAGSTATPAAIPILVTLPAPTAQASQTATPAAIPIPVTLPSPTTQAGSVAAPTAISVPVTIGAVSATGAGNTAPAAINVIVSLPQTSASGSAQGTSTPNVISVGTSLPSATPLAGSTATPDAISVVIDVPSVTASGGTAATATPDAINVAVTLPAVITQAGSTASPAVIMVPVALGAVTPQAGAVASPNVINVAVSMGAVTATGVTAASPGAINVAVTLPPVSLNSDGLATPAAISVLVSVLAVSIISGVILSRIEITEADGSMTITAHSPSMTITATDGTITITEG